MEAFSDGVIAVLITIMVLELRPPEEFDLHALREEVVPTLLAYILSFVMLGIYWNNHHHMLQLTERINGRVLWANLHLLFWLSLFPFCTAWMGRSHAAQDPTALYAVVLIGAALAYFLLQQTIIRSQGRDSALALAIGDDLKGKASPVIYLVALAFSFLATWVSVGLFVVVALIWLVPDRRLEHHIAQE